MTICFLYLCAFAQQREASKVYCFLLAMRCSCARLFTSAVHMVCGLI